MLADPSDLPENVDNVAPVCLHEQFVHELFTNGHDPSPIVILYRLPFVMPGPPPDPCVSVALQHPSRHAHLLANPCCFNSSSNIGFLLIVDTGASVCISPYYNNFRSYHHSTLTIKDLSSTNTVKGEGIL